MNRPSLTGTTLHGTTHVGVRIWEGTRLPGVYLEGKGTVDEVFDQVVQLHPAATRLVLEELGPGEDWVPIIDRVEVTNG